jgi:hypothetical protein
MQTARQDTLPGYAMMPACTCTSQLVGGCLGRLSCCTH